MPMTTVCIAYHNGRAPTEMMMEAIPGSRMRHHQVEKGKNEKKQWKHK